MGWAERAEMANAPEVTFTHALIGRSTAVPLVARRRVFWFPRAEGSDPAFKADIQAWAKRFGHEIVSFESGAVCRATIVKA